MNQANDSDMHVQAPSIMSIAVKQPPPHPQTMVPQQLPVQQQIQAQVPQQHPQTLVTAPVVPSQQPLLVPRTHSLPSTLPNHTVNIKKARYSLRDFIFHRTLGTGSFGRVHLGTPPRLPLTPSTDN